VSDSSQGPGWWQASDGKWYPPEQQPGYQQPAPGGGGYGTPYGGGPTGGGAFNGSFDVGAAFSWTVNKFQQSIQHLLLLGLVVGGIPAVMRFIAEFSNSAMISMAFSVASALIGLILMMLTVQAGLEITSTGTLNPSDMWRFKANIGQFVLGAILFAILLVLGCFALCIGLVVVWLILGLWQFVLVDRGVGAIDSLTQAKDLVLGPGFGNTFLGMLIFLVLSMISSVTAIWCFPLALIGIVSIPFASLFGAYVYRSYSGQPIAA
jgi:hypothetical protein